MILPIWTLNEAAVLCAQLELLCKGINCHVALGGSVLIDGGSYKDVDIFIYPHTTTDEKVTRELIFRTLSTVLNTHVEKPCCLEYAKDQKYLGRFYYNDKRVDIFTVTAL